MAIQLSQDEFDRLAGASSPMADGAARAVFISYARADNEGSDRAKRWLDRLKEQLEPLVQQDKITICSDQDIGLGDDWHANIQTQLNGARAAVLLVSPAFLASKYIRSNELPVLLRNAKERGVKIIPVILRPCLFEETRFKYPDPRTGPEEFTLASLQAVGSPKRALSEMSEGEQDRALLEVARALAKLIAAEPGPSGAPVVDPLSAYRQRLIRELADNPRYRLDARFVSLSLLLTRDPGATAAETRDYEDLGLLLRENAEDRAFVLLGAPGAGKSTLLRHLQLQDARGGARNQDGERVSFLISLNAYPKERSPTPVDWLAQEWDALATGLPGFETLTSQGRLLLLLDALNELRHDDRDDLQARIDAWRDFLPGFAQAGNTAVVACRRLEYTTLSTKDRLQVRRVTIKPLPGEKIHDFLRAYLPDRAEAAWTQLKDDEKQLELLGTPYFLRLLVDQIKPDGSMPRGRAELFTGFVRATLKRELDANNRLLKLDALLDEDDRQRLARDDEETWSGPHDLPEEGCLIPKLSELAFDMQRTGARGEGGQVSMAKAEARKMLAHPLDREIFDAGEQLNILDEAGKNVQFFHQLLQEYFAARIFARRPEPGLVQSEWRAERIQPSLHETLTMQADYEPLPAPPATGWEETAVIATAMAVRAGDFIAGIANVNLPLAGRCAAALDARLSSTWKADLQCRLLARMTDREADLRARIEAGLRLGELGDPRFERRSGPHGEYLMPPLIPVEPGDYLIGDDQSTKDDEKPAHKVSLTAFEIGQYPVTNAEFGLFLRSGGYGDDRWWDTAAAKAWRSGQGAVEGQRESWRDWRRTLQQRPEEHWQGMIEQQRATAKQVQDWLTIRNWSDEEFEGWLREQFKEGEVYDKPRFWDDPSFNNPSQPVVGVCWHEARAYCAWLSAQTGTSFRLPSEAEWEAAARGREGRRYAYPGDFDPARCNTFESHIRRTTPVGLFAEGSTPEGIADLTGNVWDWTSSAYLTYPYEAIREREDPMVEAKYRVVRGGSWRVNRAGARAAYRSRCVPGDRTYYFGFRVVRGSAPVP